MIVLGDVKRLHVRVDIDENDLPLFDRNAEAVATLKGRSKGRFPLKFVYVEPYVIPKKSLTGDNSERVDTRVLQVVYALPDDRPVDVYVGQQMDVYLKASDSPIAISLDAYGEARPNPFGKDERRQEHVPRPSESPRRLTDRPGSASAQSRAVVTRDARALRFVLGGASALSGGGTIGNGRVRTAGSLRPTLSCRMMS